MEIIEKKIEDITPYEKNPRRNDKAVDAVANSIKEFGFKVPIVIDKDGIIVAGHTRYKAAKKLRMKSVPCIVASDLTNEQIKAFRLSDNRTAELAEWDMELLTEELDDILNIDMSEFGFDIELDDIEEKNEIKEDTVPHVKDGEPKAKIGQIYQLGRHRLMCGDSTSIDNVKKLMNGAKADLVFTDPPYGMKKENEGVLNDNLNYDDLLEFNKKWISLSFDNLKDNGSWYCWGTDEPLIDIYSNILKPLKRQNKITFRNLITWDKGFGQGQLSSEFRIYPIADEKCLFVMCGVQGFNTNQDNYFEGWEPIRSYLFNEWRKISSKNDWDKYLGNAMGKHYFTKSQWLLPTKEQYMKLQALGKGHQAFKKDYEEIKKDYYKTRAYFNNTHDNMNNVWHFNRTTGKEREAAHGHATPKPVALCGRAIETSSREDEIVLDLFGGSGSTLIACEQLNRKCYMMELDPLYVDVILDRWEKFTGEKAIKEE